jgi:PAS domain S-box-containing protein
VWPEINFVLLLITIAFLIYLRYQQRQKIEINEVLIKTEQQYKTLVTNIRDYAIFMLDINGNVITWNVGAEKIKGYNEEEILGRNFNIFYSQEARESGWPQEELKIAEQNGRCEDEGWRIRKDGSRFWASVVITAIRNTNGKLVGFGKVTRDLTENKLKQEEINQLNKALATRLEAAEAFNRSLSHDLNAPLRSIDGFTEVLEQDYQALLDDKGKDCVKRIRKAIIKMRQLIKDMMRLAVVTQPGMERVNLVKLSLSNLYKSIASEYKMADPHRNIEIDIAPDMEINVDPEFFSLVAQNLFDNAWKYTRKTAGAVIHIGKVQVKGKTAYYITDNGIGFDQSKADQLFKPFSRLTTDKDFDGSGIGLTIVKRIIELHGGEVWGEGHLGEGATFYFTLGT